MDPLDAALAALRGGQDVASVISQYTGASSQLADDAEVEVEERGPTYTFSGDGLSAVLDWVRKHARDYEDVLDVCEALRTLQENDGVRTVTAEFAAAMAQRVDRLAEKKLTYKARKQLPAGSFVFPKKRGYPIHDIAHARNALARVSAHGSSSEKAAVRRAVYARYPQLKNGDKKD